MTKIKVTIAGASGFMGQTLLRLAGENGFDIVGATDKQDGAELGQYNQIKVLANVVEACKDCDAFIDFSTPAATISALKALKTTSTKVVIIGTTGFSAAENETIAEYANDFVIVKSGNFSLGVNILAKLVRQAAKALGEDWDIEITEAHHRRKVDAPSGTALLLGEAAAYGRAKSLEDVRIAMREGNHGARPIGGIGFSSIRGGSIIGEHDVRFESDSESISLGHTAHDRSIFAKGALAAAKWAITQKNGLYDMGDVLGD